MNLAVTVPPTNRAEDHVYQISYEVFQVNSDPRAKPTPTKPVRQKVLQFHNIQIPPSNQRPGTSVVQGIAYYVQNRPPRSLSPSCTLGLKKGRGKCKIQEIAEEFRKQIRQAERGSISQENQQLLRDLRRIRRSYGDVCEAEEFKEHQLDQEEKQRIQKTCKENNLSNLLQRNSRSFRNSFADVQPRASVDRGLNLARDADIILENESFDCEDRGCITDRQTNQQAMHVATARPHSAFQAVRNQPTQAKCEKTALAAKDWKQTEHRESTFSGRRPDSANLFSVCEHAVQNAQCRQNGKELASGERPRPALMPTSTAGSPMYLPERLFEYAAKDGAGGRGSKRCSRQSDQTAESLAKRQDPAQLNVISRDQSLICRTFSDIDGGFLLTQKQQRCGSPSTARRRSTVFETFSFYK